MVPERLPWLKRRWPVLLVGGMVLVALLVTLFGEVGILGTVNLYRKERQLMAENARLREENEKLRQEVEKLRSNPAYIEEIARRELGLMDKREIVIPLDRKQNPAPPSASRGAAGPP